MEIVERATGSTASPPTSGRVPVGERVTLLQGGWPILLGSWLALLILGCGENIASLNQKALAHMEAGELATAEELLLEALRCAPDEEAIHANLAEVYCRLGRFEKAQHHQSRCVELAGGRNPDYNRRLAEILMRTRRTGEAVSKLEKLREESPDDPEIAYALCVAYLWSDDEVDTRALLDQCRRQFPDNPFFQSLESRLALRHGDLDTARNLLEGIVQQHPDFAEGHLLLGDLYFESGEFPKAADRYQAALAAHNSPEITFKLGRTYSRLGEVLPAEKHLRDAVRSDYEGEALLELGHLYLRNPGQQWSRNRALSQAFESCDRILAADPYNTRARNLKAMIYAGRRQLGPMLDEFNKSLTINPDQPAVRAVLEAYQSDEGQ